MLVVLGIMVLVHEFGHFAMAKFFGVRVEVFSIGFGKRLFGIKRGDTDYRISLLPLGGYVKMSGESPGDSRTGDPAEFASHPRWQRILIGLAGPAANFLLAFLLMTGLYMMHNEVPNYMSGPAITDVVPPDTPAAKAGIQPGDRIVRFDKDINPTWEQVGMRSALDANSYIPLTVARNANGQAQHLDLELFLADPSKGQHFELDTIGLLPRVQDGPLGVRGVMPGNPADKAGLKAGDKIVSVDSPTGSLGGCCHGHSPAEPGQTRHRCRLARRPDADLHHQADLGRRRKRPYGLPPGLLSRCPSRSMSSSCRCTRL